MPFCITRAAIAYVVLEVCKVIVTPPVMFLAIKLRLAFAASFVVCDMHTTEIFMILNHSLAFMLSF